MTCLSEQQMKLELGWMILSSWKEHCANTNPCANLPMFICRTLPQPSPAVLLRCPPCWTGHYHPHPHPHPLQNFLHVTLWCLHYPRGRLASDPGVVPPQPWAACQTWVLTFHPGLAARLVAVAPLAVRTVTQINTRRPPELTVILLPLNELHTRLHSQW